MNELTEMKNIMTSKDISELTGKRHDNVMVKCRELFNRKIIVTPESQERDLRGKIYPIFRLNKIESLNLVAYLSPEFTSKIIDGMEVMMKAVDPSKVKIATEYVFSTLEKVTKCYYESSLIPGKRVKFNGEIK